MEKQHELKDEIVQQWRSYLERMPGVKEAYEASVAEAYSSGVLDAKTKRLMALTAALVSGCRGCILTQSSNALELGATLEEFQECIAVALSLGGSMAGAEATRLLVFLDEKGLIPRDSQ